MKEKVTEKLLGDVFQIPRRHTTRPAAGVSMRQYISESLVHNCPDYWMDWCFARMAGFPGIEAPWPSRSVTGMCEVDQNGRGDWCVFAPSRKVDDCLILTLMLFPDALLSVAVSREQCAVQLKIGELIFDHYSQHAPTCVLHVLMKALTHDKEQKQQETQT